MEEKQTQEERPGIIEVPKEFRPVIRDHFQRIARAQQKYNEAVQVYHAVFKPLRLLCNAIAKQPDEYIAIEERVLVNAADAIGQGKLPAFLFEDPQEGQKS